MRRRGLVPQYVWRSEDHFEELVLFHLYEGSGTRTQMAMHSRYHLMPIHLSKPAWIFLLFSYMCREASRIISLNPSGLLFEAGSIITPSKGEEMEIKDLGWGTSVCKATVDRASAPEGQPELNPVEHDRFCLCWRFIFWIRRVSSCKIQFKKASC